MLKAYQPRSASRLNVTLCAEDQLLLSLAQPHIGELTQAAIEQLLTAGINWDLFLRNAHHHWVVLQIYAPLKKYCKGYLPSDLLNQLDRYFLANVARSLCFTEELLTLLQLFADHQIDAIPFKGPILAVSAYGNLAHRKFSDLDILVSPHDFHRAIELLISQAHYQEQPTTFEIYDHEYPLVHGTKDIAVDLHQQISGKDFYSFPMSLEALKPRLIEVSMMGTTVKSFHPEDTILMLCIHGSKHTWDQLGWLCDFAAYVQSHPDVNWPRVIEKAKALGVLRLLSLGLLLSHELLNVTIPQNIQKACNADILIAQELSQRLFYPTSEMTKEFSFQRFSLHLRMMERVSDQGAYIRWNIRRLLTPTFKDTQKVSLPPAFHFLHYGIRFLRLTKLFSFSLITRTE